MLKNKINIKDKENLQNIFIGFITSGLQITYGYIL